MVLFCTVFKKIVLVFILTLYKQFSFSHLKIGPSIIWIVCATKPPGLKQKLSAAVVIF